MSDKELDALIAKYAPDELVRSPYLTKAYGKPMFMLHAMHTLPDGRRVYSTVGGEAVSTPVGLDSAMKMLRSRGAPA